MANASNNGLLPLTNGQQGQQGYSQVSPMMSMYYNAAQAPQGNQVLGYNSASPFMPGSINSAGAANPTPPSGGNLSLGGTSQSGGNSSTFPGASSSGNNTTGYGSAPAGHVASGAYGAANTYAMQQPRASAPPPVAAPAQAHYNPSGPLASPNVHAIPAQVQANSAGQMQGNSHQSLANWQQAQLPPGFGHPPITAPGGGDGSAPYGSTPVSKPPAPPVYTDPGKGGNPPGFGKPITENPGKPPVKKPPAKPPSALDKWLAGDTTYQQQLAEYNQEQQAYNQNYTNDKNSIDQNYNATQRSMNNQANLDRMNQQYDFAGRGVLTSGAFAQALDQYNTQFQNNMANLTQGENQQLTANQTNLNNFLRQLTIQRDAAKQDAIARRAAQLGITG